MVQTLKILSDAYKSSIVHGQSTLKDIIERYFRNGLSREHLKATKALYANVLVEKRTLDSSVGKRCTGIAEVMGSIPVQA